MKIRFLTSCMSAEGVFTAGREYIMSDAMGAGFVAAGHAVTVPEESFEEATVETPVETAVLSASPSRKKRK